MATRGTIRGWILNALGTSSDDPAYSATILDPIIQQSVDALLNDINQVNPGYLSTTVTLEAVSATSHTYVLTSQASDFARYLEVRLEDAEGIELADCRIEDLRRAGAEHFAIIGADDAASLITSPDTEAGIDLWMRYAQWPAVLASDSDSPSSIPSRFHDVVFLESLFAFGLGGEQRLPPELYNRWQDRRGQLIAHVGRRGVQATRTRIVEDYE